ncbi:MAG: glutamine amidotransferase [Heliobacteriaceae bacterium]|jgi:CobQ-like glutamine amidotransferase family enzyme|nr:glutamine amidotransferase [Heliobacteriaceae bacterium]
METMKITHLYPKSLNLYGDMGNLLTLVKRCEWRGIGVEINEVSIGDKIPESNLYFMGGGQDCQQVEVSREIVQYKEFLIEQRDKGAVFLGICGGYQLFGHYYQPFEGKKLLGAGLLDAYTVAGKKRFIGNVTVQTDFLVSKTLVGFENHSGLTYLQGETKPLGRVSTGHGNNGEDKTEGARFKNVFGTYLHGSVLPKNPHFADYLIELALGHSLAPLDDEIEIKTHKSLVGKAY